MIPEDQLEEIKKQIIGHIKETFPEDKKAAGISQIESMGSKELEEFLEKNKLMKQEQNQEGQCIFCLISSGKVPAYKINESKNSDIFLEINPISKGHMILIPKKHSEEIPKEIFSFADKFSKKIKSKLKPKGVIVSQGTLFGHGIVNLIPVYSDETEKSERYKAEEDELKEIHEIMTKKTIKKLKTKKISEKLWLPKRIP